MYIQCIAMPELDRITQLGMLEDLRIRNAEVTSTKYHLTEIFIPDIARIVLGYVSGIVHPRIIDTFKLNDWPIMDINGCKIDLEYAYDENNDTGIVIFIRQSDNAWMVDCDVRNMWNMIMHETTPFSPVMDLANIMNLTPENNNPVVIAAFQKLRANILNKYVTPA